MLTVVMVRHGRIDPSDKELLSRADPHLDRDWVENELPGKAEAIRGIPFDNVVTGPLHRMVETAEPLCEALGIATGFYYSDALSAKSTYHDGKIYGEIDPMKKYMGEMVAFFRMLDEEYRYNRSDFTVLLVTSGARMVPTEALARGLGPEDFADDDAMVNWALDPANNANPATGEAWGYDFDRETGKVERIEDLNSLKGTGDYAFDGKAWRAVVKRAEAKA